MESFFKFFSWKEAPIGSLVMKPLFDFLNKFLTKTPFWFFAKEKKMVGIRFQKNYFYFNDFRWILLSLSKKGLWHVHLKWSEHFLELVEIWRTLPKSDAKNKFRSLEIFPWNCFCIETEAIICSVILIFIHFKNHKWRIMQINVFCL